jgi:hypothetical protein
MIADIGEIAKEYGGRMGSGWGLPSNGDVGGRITILSVLWLTPIEARLV